jgi:hypothetical protein
MATGYGVDTWCGSSLQTGRLAKGRQNLGLACFRRLITPRGTLQGLTDDDEEADYGLDLAGYVGALDDRDVRNAVGPAIRAELMKDDRVRDVATTLTHAVETNGLTTYTIDVRVLPVDEDTELTLTLAVSAVTVTLIGIST